MNQLSWYIVLLGLLLGYESNIIMVITGEISMMNDMVRCFISEVEMINANVVVCSRDSTITLPPSLILWLSSYCSNCISMFSYIKKHIMNCRHPIFKIISSCFLYKRSVLLELILHIAIPFHDWYSMVHHSVGIPIYSIIFNNIHLQSSLNAIESHGCKPFVYCNEVQAAVKRYWAPFL